MKENRKHQGYDIIGDIHGCYNTLVNLLGKLEYSQQEGTYQHASRKIIFLGDFVDRCSGQREVINIVRPMIESGSALAVMGNHEYNAVAYHRGLRERSKKNRDQHEAFLNEYQDNQEEYDDVINWFKTLPLWLDLGDLRVVHACWDSDYIELISKEQGGGNLLTDVLLEQSSIKRTPHYRAIETLLKGKEVTLPGGGFFHDEGNHKRRKIRVRWWDKTATTFRKAFLGSEETRKGISDNNIPEGAVGGYGQNAPPVFLGHYWMEGEPAKLANNVACLDCSVAKTRKKENEGQVFRLVAYRWGGERKLDDLNFCWVSRHDGDLSV